MNSSNITDTIPPEVSAKISERKTVHEWLNALGIPREERGKPLCLLRRLRITCDRYDRMQDALSEMESYHSCTSMQYDLIASALAPHEVDPKDEPGTVAGTCDAFAKLIDGLPDPRL